MGRNQATIDATVNILQACLVDKRLVSTNECAALLDALTTIAQASSRKQGDSLMRLLDARGILQQPPGNSRRHRWWVLRIRTSCFSSATWYP